MAFLQANFEMAIYSDLGQELVPPAPHAAEMIKAIVCSYFTMPTWLLKIKRWKPRLFTDFQFLNTYQLNLAHIDVTYP